MLSTEKAVVRDVIRKAWVIWAVMFGSLPVVFIGCYVMADTLKKYSVQDFPLSTARNILLVVSAIIFVMIGYTQVPIAWGNLSRKELQEQNI